MDVKTDYILDNELVKTSDKPNANLGHIQEVAMIEEEKINHWCSQISQLNLYAILL